MTNKELADLMYPNVKLTIKDLEEKYPNRNLESGAVVSRYAPSPTGFVHMGNMLSCFIESFLPKKTNGAFYLRIEDTDQKREVKDGINNIINSINSLGIDYDEGVVSLVEQKGNYGPYIQSQRKEIYDVFAKYMIENNIAYPCFCDATDLNETREYQRKNKLRIGYYGEYAKCRHLSNDECAKKIKDGKSYTIRLKSTGNFNNKVKFKDLVKGLVIFPENDQDIILIKSDGIPVYHFAYVVDDHLMHTTHILRGEDWLSSVPVHIELFNKLGFERPKYAHLGLIMIVDENGNKRKISKRKDKDFTVENYISLGFPKVALQEYLMTIANTNFEGWRNANPNSSLYEFDFSFSKVGSNPLFDYSKLVNISKNYICRMSNKQLYDELLSWTKKYDKQFNNILINNKEYSLKVLNIEREKKKPRKDYSVYSDVRKLSWYMFDELFNNSRKNYEWQKISKLNEIKEIINYYFNNYYDETDNQNVWFDKMKQLADKLGYATNMKDYKVNPNNYKGSITDIATVIRVAITTESNTPDLYEILNVLGLTRIKERIKIINDKEL